MKKVIFFLLIATASCYCRAQDYLLPRDIKKFTIIDTTFIRSDSLSRAFYDINNKLIHQLYWQIDKLPFDKCKFPEISYALYINELGKIEIVDLLTKINNRVDSLVKNEIASASGHWIPAKRNDSPEKILFLSGYTKPGHVRLIFDAQKLRTAPLKDKECEDDDFFYNTGVKYFKEENFKTAIYNFKQALKSNPYDSDALYNLGLSYLKTEKTEKACEVFNELLRLEDERAKDLIEKHCVK